MESTQCPSPLNPEATDSSTGNDRVRVESYTTALGSTAGSRPVDFSRPLVSPQIEVASDPA
jgi:hypothetical protein